MNAAARQQKKMIVLGHDASRTGAPIFLLHLTEWLKRHGTIDFEIILKHGGPLLAEFKKIAPTTVLAHTRAERLIHRCLLQRSHLPILGEERRPAVAIETALATLRAGPQQGH